MKKKLKFLILGLSIMVSTTTLVACSEKKGENNSNISVAYIATTTNDTGGKELKVFNTKKEKVKETYNYDRLNFEGKSNFQNGLVYLGEKDDTVSLYFLDEEGKEKEIATNVINYDVYEDTIFYIGSDGIYKYTNNESTLISEESGFEILKVIDKDTVLYSTVDDSVIINCKGEDKVVVEGVFAKYAECKGDRVFISCDTGAYLFTIGSDKAFQLTSNEVANFVMNDKEVIYSDEVINEEGETSIYNVCLYNYEENSNVVIIEDAYNYSKILSDGENVYYRNNENNLIKYNIKDETKEIILEEVEDLLGIYDGKILYSLYFDIGYIENGENKELAKSYISMENNENNYAVITEDEKLIVNGDVVEEKVQVDERYNSLHCSEDYVYYVKNDKYMVYDIKNNKSIALTSMKDKKDTEIVVDNSMVEFLYFNMD